MLDKLHLAALSRLVCVTVALLAAALLNVQPAAAQASIDHSEEIVYIDPAGYIRVLDVMHTGRGKTVLWASPAGGWRDIALGDFNGDGDLEVVAIGGEATTGRLSVYDPVVASGPITPEQRINDIPWDLLYSTPVIGKPTLIAAGNFVPDTPGDEIIYGVSLRDEADPQRFIGYAFTVLKNGGATPDGRTWTVHVDAVRFDHEWTWVSVGDIQDDGVDEIALVDEDAGLLAVYRIGTTLVGPLFEHGSESFPWQAAVISQFRTGGNRELVATRNAPPSLASVWSFEYVDGRFVDGYNGRFEPSPRYIFAADINASGDKEIFLLRNVPATASAPRLFMRNFGSDTTRAFEEALDSDNGYRAGAGGNVDADTAEEVVVIRNNRIRVYDEPATSNAYTQHNFSTNERSIAIGDLDRNGFVVRPQVGAVPQTVSTTLNQGERSAPYVIELVDSTGSRELPFTVSLEGGQCELAGSSYQPDEGICWVEATATSATTPATLRVVFDSNGFFPGFYQTNLLIDSPDPEVANTPYRIPVALTIRSALISSTPGLSFIYFPCAAPLEARSAQVRVDGPPNMSFTARLVAGEDNAPVLWATVSPTAGATGDTLTVTVDPEQRPSDFATARLILRPPEANVQPAVVTVQMACADAQTFLPQVHNR